MSNTKTVEFEIEGDPVTELGKPGAYRMEFDFNALVRAENLTGLNLMAFAGGMSAGQHRAHVYAALAKHHPQVTLEDAGALLSKAKGKVMDALGDLYDQSSGDAGAIGE